MNRKLKISLIGLAMAGAALGGCVESDQSVVMMGSVIGDGEVDEETGAVTCSLPTEFDDASIRTTGFIDLEDLRDVGQPLIEGSGPFTPDEYHFGAVMENRLFDSRSVGAVSGGDGGGYENLTLDKNDIFIQGVTVRLSSENNNFGFISFPDWDRERYTNMLVPSGGGSANLTFPLISGAAERAQFQSFFDADVVQQNLDEDGRLTFVFEIQLNGQTQAGNSVNSNILEYPITMCNGCTGEGRFGVDALCILSN